jgi:hypothetical protein
MGAGWRPVGIGEHPEDVLGFVLIRASALSLRATCDSLSRSARLVGVFGIGSSVVIEGISRAAALGTRDAYETCEELGAVFLKGIGDVFEEDETGNDVLVFRSFHVVLQLVGGEPELCLKADGGRRIYKRRCFRTCSHVELKIHYQNC